MAHQQPPDDHQPQQPYYLPPPYGAPQQPVYYQQPYVAPVQQHGKIVSKHRMGVGGHSIHATLTLLTCGMWAPIWFLAWLLKRGKTVTRY
jgi:hypothetical protein